MGMFSDTVSIPESDRLVESHNDLSRADEELVLDCVSALVDSMPDVSYLDDLEVHTIDRAGDSPHEHVNKKEVVSGDATAWVAVESDFGGETEKKFEIEYEVHAGSEGGSDGFVYDPIEVSVVFK